MKKYVIKLVTLLVFASVVISSCSVEYRQRRMHRHDPNWHDPNDHDHHYDNVHHN